MKANCEVGSIRAVLARLKSEGYEVSEYSLRLWVRQGQLHSVHTGSKVLISFENVVSLLKGNTNSPTPQ